MDGVYRAPSSRRKCLSWAISMPWTPPALTQAYGAAPWQLGQARKRRFAAVVAVPQVLTGRQLVFGALRVPFLGPRFRSFAATRFAPPLV